MRLRKPCEHGWYDAHLFHRWGTHPTQCPGGEFLPEGALVIEGMIVSVQGQNDDPWLVEVSTRLQPKIGRRYVLVPFDALFSQVGEVT